MKGYLDKTLLWLSIAGFLVQSASFPLMPLDSMGFLPGILFWAGLLLGVVLQITLEFRRRRFFKTRHLDRRNFQKVRCGAFMFFAGPAGAAADVGFLISAIGLVIVWAATNGIGYGCFVLSGAALFFLEMHCVCNGRNFFHANHTKRVIKALERKKNEKNDDKKKERM